MAVVQHVVADSGAFIRNAPIKDIGKNVYTLPDVVQEIRDKATKQRLQVLPYELKYKEPSSESIKYVTDFSKKTGDYSSLSAVDLRVLALVYQLEKQHVGTEHIRTEPMKKIVINSTPTPGTQTQIAGFYLPKAGDKDRTRTTTESSRPSESDDTSTSSAEKIEEITNNLPEKHLQISKETTSNCALNKAPQMPSSEESPQSETPKTADIEIIDAPKKECAEEGETPVGEKTHQMEEEGHVIPENLIQERDSSEEEEEEGEDDEEDDDDDGGWITPSNIRHMKESIRPQEQVKAEVCVGCITTDFAMQNVLIQMGLNVVSVDGMLIKKVKSYVLRCTACMRITSRMEKVFCPHCGNHTLRRLAVTVDDDGTMHYHFSKRRVFSLRGLKHSLPTPKGGKYAQNPILCEDQRMPHQRVSTAARKKTDIWEYENIPGSSPFAVNDVTSRAAHLGVHVNRNNARSQKNPNASKKRKGRRK